MDIGCLVWYRSNPTCNIYLHFKGQRWCIAVQEKIGAAAVLLKFTIKRRSLNYLMTIYSVATVYSIFIVI